MEPMELIKQLVDDKGAVLELAEPSVVMLVGAAELVDPTQLFFFEAGKDDQSGGHLLEFAELRTVEDWGVSFHNPQGQLVAYLSTIPEASLPSDVEAAFIDGWTAWQRALQDPASGPRIREFIASIRESLLHPEI